MLSSNPSVRHTRRLGVASIILAVLCCLLAIAHADRSSSSSAGETNAQSSSKTEKQQQPDKIANEAAELSSAFDSWTKKYLAAANPESLAARGKQLAAKRRALLRDLIMSDPARALSLAVTTDIRRRMPSEIQENLEEQINACGDYWVVVSDEIDPASGKFIRARIDRMVVIHGKIYKAAVYGRWLGMTSKKNIPINGIAIDDVLALNEAPVKTARPCRA